MASEWQEIRLGEVVRFKTGSAFKPEYQGQPSGEIPFIKVSDLNLAGNEHAIHHAKNWISCDLAREIKAAIHPAGATVFAKIGIALTYNRRRLLIRDTAIDNNMMSAIPDENVISPRYLYFLLQNLDFNEVVHGSALPYLNISDLQKIEVALPSLEEQRAISDVLGMLDDRIDNLRQTNATLEAIAAALFKSWFVDFDGVPPEDMQESELGLIPKGWRPGTLKDVCIIHDSKRIPLSSTERAKRHGEFPYYGAAGVMDSVDDYLFDGIYVLLGEDGSVQTKDGYALTQYVWGKFWVNNHAHVIEGKNGYSSEQLLLVLRRVLIGKYITGAVQPKLSQGNMLKIPIVLPTEEVAARFAEIIQPIFKTIRCNSEHSATLAALRDTMLPRLISGKLRVGEAVRIVEETL